MGGIAHYRLTPIELEIQLMRFILDLGVKVIGGCCGIGVEEIKAISVLKNLIFELPQSKAITKKKKRSK